MNWISFITWLGALYALYYFLMIVLDNRTSVAPAHPDGLPVLTFSEQHPPEKIMLEDFTDSGLGSGAAPASVGLAGVSLKALFDLAREDAIEYTRPVSF